MLSAALALFGIGAQAQVSSYAFAQASGTYTPNVGGTSIVAAGTDDGNSAATNIGFNFTYNGTVFTQFVANSNGSIRLGSAATTSQYSPISTTSNTNAIAGAARDGRSGVNTLLTGAPGSQVLTIEYPDFQMSYLNATNPLPFQIKLYEGTNAVQIVYGTGSATASYTAQVGLRGSTTAGDVSTRTTTTNWNTSTAGTQSSTMSWGTTVTVPASGLTFTWTPPVPCSTVTAGAAVASVASGCGSLASSTLSLSGASSGVTGLSYQWYSGPVGGPYTTLLGTGATQGITAVTSTTAYVCTVTCANGGATATSTEAVITINPAITATASASPVGPFCGTAATTLTATGGLTYSWLPVTGLSDPTSATPTCTATTTTTYTVTATGVGGCTGTATVTVTIIPNPVFSSVTATPATICVNGNSQLQANATQTTTISNLSFAQSSGTYTPNVGGTSILAAGTDDGNSPATNIGFSFSFNGTVFTQFVANSNGSIRFGAAGPTSQYAPISTAGNTNAIAGAARDGRSGVNTLLTGAPGSQVLTIEYPDFQMSYLNANNPLSFQIKLYEGTNAVQIVYGSGSAIDTYTAQVGLRGSATAGDVNTRTTTTDWNTSTAGTELSTMAWGTTVTVPASGLTFTWTPPTLAYLWTPNTYLNFDNIANPLASAVAATTPYSVTATGFGGCTATSGVTVNTSAPISAASITGTLSFCAGGSTTLTAVPADGGGPFTYLWSPGGETTASITASAGGSYSAQVTDACGGSVNTGNVTVTVNALPSVSVSPSVGPANVWSSGSLTFVNSGGVGSDAMTAQTSLTRAITGVIYNSVCQAPPGGPGCSYAGPCNTEWAIGTIANYNTLTYDELYNVNGCNPPSMVGQTMVCHLIAENIYVQITWNSWGAGGGGFSYTRTTGPSVLNYCIGNPALNLTASGASTYSWSPSTGLDATTVASVNASPTTTTTYTVTGTGANGCVNTATSTVTVLGTNPVITSTTATPGAICVGETSQLQVNLQGPAAYCATSYSSGTGFGDYLSSVSIPGTTLSNATGASPSPFYTLFPASGSTTATLAAGSSYSLDAVAGTYTSNDVAVWIDYNQNGVFTDAGEKLGQVDNFGAAPAVASIAFTVPAGAINGTTRMRVREADQGITGGMPDCGALVYGEVEDYDVTITGGSNAVTYAWTPSGSLSSATIANPVATPTATTTYNVTVTNASGCFATGSAAVTVSPVPATPVVTATPDAICQGGSTNLLVAPPAVSAYCTTSYSSGTAFGDYCSLVSVAGTSLNSVSGASSSPYYTLFPATGSTTGTFVAGTAYVLTVSAGTYTINDFAAWIDYNNDGVFTDATEKLGQVDNIGAAPATGTISFTVPLTAINGPLRMRVREADQGGQIPACGALTYGEVEDYTVTITGGVTTSYTYSWTPTTFLDDATIANPTASGMTATTVYTATIINASGCGTSNTVTVTVDVTDTDGDGTADCADGCPADPLKTDPGICGCGVADVPTVYFDDTDADGLGDPAIGFPSYTCVAPPPGFVANSDDDCPLVFGTIGDACDDGNINTINDVLNALCVCEGTPVLNCPDNLVFLDITTDNDGAQTSWEIIPQGGGAAVCGGSGLASNSTITANCCLPTGSYSLRVLDSFGDGMSNGPVGGYVLRDSNGDRIIDNAGDGVFNFVSQAPDFFYVPLSADRLTTATCDQESVSPSYVIQAQENLAVSGQLGVTSSTSGYQFWFFNPDGGYSRRVIQTLAAPGSSFPTGTTAALRPTFLRLNSLSTNPVPPYVLLNVRVRQQIAGVLGQFGPACRMKVDPPCTTTQLTTLGQPSNPAASCGATGLVIAGGLVYADIVTGANRYQFEFTRPGFSRLIAVPTRTLTLGWVTKPLQCGLAYTVRVRASFDNGATWCAFGSVCTVTTESCPAIAGGDDRELIGVDGSDLNLWPNPNRNENLRLSIDDLGATYETATVDITDMFGKRVMARTIGVQGSTLNVVLELNDMASGMYMVNVTVGEKTYMKRLMIQ